MLANSDIPSKCSFTLEARIYQNDHVPGNGLDRKNITKLVKDIRRMLGQVMVGSEGVISESERDQVLKQVQRA